MLLELEESSRLSPAHQHHEEEDDEEEHEGDPHEQDDHHEDEEDGNDEGFLQCEDTKAKQRVCECC